jgi:hypothetical protein
MSSSTNFALLILVTIMLGSCSLEPVPQVLTNAESSSPKPSATHLPTVCRSLLAQTDSSKWNPRTETYEVPDDWAECMGVGKK